MHLSQITLHPENYPTTENYPFNLQNFHQTKELTFQTPVTIFVGENGTGKSTLLEAITLACDIFIWRRPEWRRFEVNPFEHLLRDYINVKWVNGRVPGSYFSSEIYHYFTRVVDEWAVSDPNQLSYFGGKSLVTQSHGESLMSYFTSRYQIRGLYMMDEPETALSPKTQLELLDLLTEMSAAGHAQFIIATHSPILLACPGATIYSFDHTPVRKINYGETEHYKIYHSFLTQQEDHLQDISG